MRTSEARVHGRRHGCEGLRRLLSLLKLPAFRGTVWMYSQRYLEPSLGLVLSVFLTATLLHAQSPSLPPQDPQLRIEPGMHTGQITRIAADATCSTLVTGSHDKTVRSSGDCLKAASSPHCGRPSVPPTTVGSIPSRSLQMGVGLLPESATSPQRKETFTSSINVRQRGDKIGAFPHTVIIGLATSTDGRFLAGTLFGGGLKVWERNANAGRRDWRLVAQDDDYASYDAYGLAFDRSGTLYTASMDGKLRRYRPANTQRNHLRLQQAESSPFP